MIVKKRNESWGFSAHSKGRKLGNHRGFIRLVGVRRASQDGGGDGRNSSVELHGIDRP